MISYPAKGKLRRTHKIILLGDSGVGKTSLVEKYVHGSFLEEFNPTVGIDYFKKNVVHKKQSYCLHMWDTAGQEKYKSLTPTYLKDAICAILMFDVHNRQTLANLESWINLFLENKKEKAISVICGNKCDLDKQFDKQLLEQLIEKYKVPYFALSAKTGANISDMFCLIVEMIEREEAEKFRQIKDKYESGKELADPEADKEEYEHPAPTKQSLHVQQLNGLEASQVNDTVKLTGPSKRRSKFCCC